MVLSHLSILSLDKALRRTSQQAYQHSNRQYKNYGVYNWPLTYYRYLCQVTTMILKAIAETRFCDDLFELILLRTLMVLAKMLDMIHLLVH